jgi:peptidylprolyl isomerase
MLVLAGCSGKNSPEATSPPPLGKGPAGVTADDATLPTVEGGYGVTPVVTFPLKPGATPPPATPEATPEIQGTPVDDASGEEGSETPADGTENETPAEGTEGETPADGTEGETPAEGTEGETPADAAPSAESPSPTASPWLDPPKELQAKVLHEGDGEVIKEGNLASIDMMGQVWGGSEPIAALNTFGSGDLLVFPVTNTYWIPALAKGVVGQKVGSRVLIVAPPGEMNSMNSTLGAQETDTIVFVVDIVEQFSGTAEAQKDAKPTDEKTGPQVKGALGGPVTITIPASLPQVEQIKTTVLATGTGEPIKDGETILYRYSAVDWFGEPAGDSWTDTPGGPTATKVQANPSGDGSKTVFSDLVGVPVGSRVLVETPSKTQSYPANAIVIDIIAIAKPSPSKPAEQTISLDGAPADAGDATGE